MKILAFDTALRACSAAVWVDGETRAQRHEERDRGHAEALVPMIEDVCRQSEISYQDFDRIAVTVGPGTFAGIRIGVAAARGLAVSLAVPVVSLTTLEVVASAALGRLREGEPNVTAVFDARRGQVYAQTFDRALKPLCPPRALTPVEFAASLREEPAAIIGDGCSVVSAALTQSGRAFRFLDGPGQPDAAVVAALAPFREVAAPNTGEPTPLYLRPPDARLPAAVALSPRP